MTDAIDNEEFTPDETTTAAVRQRAVTLTHAVTGNLNAMVQAICETVEAGNSVGQPSIFTTAGSITRLGANDEGRPVIKLHTKMTFSHWLARHASWQSRNEQGRATDCYPPVGAVLAVKDMADAVPEFPVLERVVQVPFFNRRRQLVSSEGYDKVSRTWYQPGDGFTVPQVNECPSDSQVEAARSLILDDLLVDFPFATQGDRAGAVAMLLEPFVKDVIQGNTPLHLVEASTQGTGKTKLVENCLAVGLGRQPSEIAGKPLAFDEAEIRKGITTDVMSGAPVVFFDNVSHNLKSPSLAQVLTGSTWTDRKLGANENAEFKIRCGWVMTSNNAKYNKDIARRISLIRLDLSSNPDIPNSVCQNPETRTGFKHSNLEGWVVDHQDRLVWACLTLINRWLADGGRAWSGKPLGSFESWSSVMGGILEASGIDGFLTNRAEIQASGDDDVEGATAFMEMWWKTHADKAVAPGELITANQDGDDQLVKLDPRKSPAVAMGYWLKGQAGQVINGYQFQKSGRKWTLSRRDDS